MPEEGLVCCPRCGGDADSVHLRRCRRQPKIQPGDGDPRHGYGTGYNHHECRCDLCHAWMLADQARRRRNQGKPVHPGLVPWEPVADHINHLKRVGEPAAIAAAAGIDLVVLRRVMWRRPGKMRRDVAEAILGVTASDVRRHAPPDAVIDATHTKKILLELVAAGWSKTWITAELGMGRCQLLHHDGGVRIQARYARRAQALHNRLFAENATPPVSKACDNPRPLRAVCRCVRSPEQIRDAEKHRQHRAKKEARRAEAA